MTLSCHGSATTAALNSSSRQERCRKRRLRNSRRAALCALEVFSLRAPRSSREWARYHEIRRRCLFEKYNGKGTPYYFEYDPDHPDEHDPANHPLVLLDGGRVIGTIRIDLKHDGRAIFRLVAIDDPWQGQGFGTTLLALAESYARDCGADTICLNSVPDAYRFYTRHGFVPERWEGCTRNPTEIPVLKHFADQVMPLNAVPAIQFNAVPAIQFDAVPAMPAAITAVTQAAS